MAKAIVAENISKAYQIGQFTTGTLSRDLQRWVAIKRGKDDPFLRIGDINDRTTKGNSDIVWSLKDINFEIEEGDAVGVIGRNGAGKSTLLKILSRITTPTTGILKVRGRISSLLEVGTGFHPELTGRENIFLNGAILGMRKREIARNFDNIVDFAGVERFIDTPIRRYSSGMYVRLAFAVAAHLESEILIVDEVLAVGDSEFQKKCIGKLENISKGEGRTILFVTHNMGSILSLCNKGILLEKGKILVQGDIMDAVQQYSYINNIAKSSVYRGNGFIKQVTLLTTEDEIKHNSEFKVKVAFSSPVAIKKLVIGLTIKDEMDAAIIGVNNRHYIEHSLHAEEITKGVMEILFKSFPLLPGKYSIDVFLGDTSIDIEAVHDAVYFEVANTIPENLLIVMSLLLLHQKH